MSKPTPAHIAVLIVDGEAPVCSLLQRHLERLQCEVRIAATLAAGKAALAERKFDIALVAFDLVDGIGPILIKSALEQHRADAVYCITSTADCKNVVRAMRSGATDVLEKPIDLERVSSIVEAHRSASGSDLKEWRREFVPNLLGEDPAILDVLGIVRSVAETACTVLITGESGTGKEEVARAIHYASGRRDARFVTINCAAIPEALLESELFGHARGAFTGATEARSGRIVAADGGTLFLDEIGDMPLSAQAKLLRVLQDRLVTPVGSDRATPVNVRIVAATNRELDVMVEAGTFRGDLFYRLSVINVELPSLRDRATDILPLARHFIGHANEKNGRAVTGLLPEAEAVLAEHLWPGNVRELANTIERAVVLKGAGLLGAKDLRMPQKKQRRPVAPSLRLVDALAPPAAPAEPTESTEGLNLRMALDGVEKRMIEEALGRTGGNRTEAAALLGLNRSTLVEKIRKFAG